ncbi:MAG: PLP-dependent aminotransferase family protein [Casimicrobiaceae bacterium]
MAQSAVVDKIAAVVPSFARRAAHMSPTAPAAAGSHDSIPFDSGHAYPGVLPDLLKAAALALSEYRSETLQYSARPGLPEMREFITGYMNADGARVTADEILIVNGAKHGLDLVCRLLLDEGDSIVVTAPTYFTSIPIFKSFGIDFIEIGQDDEGLSVTELGDALCRLEAEGSKPPKFIYNVPDFHNPTGVTMSLRRREALLEIAAVHGIPIVEDSPYRKVRFEGDLEPSLKALDRHEGVYLLGTFSKLIAPGLRIGWVAAPRDIIARLVQLKSDGGTCPLTQRIILEFCKAGGLESHIDKVQSVYRIHRDRMVAALRRELPEVSMTIPHGGYYVWLKFPDHVDADALAKRAGELGATIIPGSKFFAGRGPLSSKIHKAPKNFARLAYSHASPDEIDVGVQRIASALKSMKP